LTELEATIREQPHNESTEAKEASVVERKLSLSTTERKLSVSRT